MAQNAPKSPETFGAFFVDGIWLSFVNIGTLEGRISFLTKTKKAEQK